MEKVCAPCVFLLVYVLIPAFIFILAFLWIIMFILYREDYKCLTNTKTNGTEELTPNKITYIAMKEATHCIATCLAGVAIVLIIWGIYTLATKINEMKTVV